jgi:Ca-activated chloride channel homolog
MKWVGVAILALASFVTAQDDVHIVPRVTHTEARLPHDAPLIKVQVDLALVPVVVTDYDGKPQSGLVKEHFKLTYDGKEQPIKYFSEDDAPISIGLVFDRSGSMGWKIDNAKAVVHAFAKQLNPDDEIFVVTFSDTVDTTDFANVSDEVENRMLFVGSKGRTSLLDAVYVAVNKMRDAKYQRRALILVSDGGDNHSRYTEREVKNLIEEADVQVFSIALVNRECMIMDRPGGPHNSCSQEEAQGPFLLEELARKGGGTGYLLDNPQDIASAIDTIGRVLRQEYILGFTPKCKIKKDSQYHKLRVKLQHLPKGTPPLRVDAKPGLYAQSD